MTHVREATLKALRARVRRDLDDLTAHMARESWPVEMTHKRGHRPDFIPDDGHGFSTEEQADTAFAMMVVGAWQSKWALTEAFNWLQSRRRCGQ